MECTQRLECTQDLYSSQCERVNPEQIGFLGICGEKFPVLRGPNKIGRDPQTCGIILNRNSISRQHAVINVLNGKQFMLMDLGSANKTRLNNKVLPSYIPSPLSNGDTVQLGEIFGIFQLLEDESDLPMTQAIDIPDTPICSRGISRLNKAGITTVPESPDLSDRDESFIVPSQPKQDHQFKSPSNKFIKSSGKTISIQPVGTNKIDNVYWKSSKKSNSFSLVDANTSLNDPVASSSSKSNSPVNNNNLHEMDTQVPHPTDNESPDSIYCAATQLPIENNSPSSFHSMDTQLPVPNSLPNEHEICVKHDMELDLFGTNKENENSLYNAETQMPIEHENGNTLNTPHTSDIEGVETQPPNLEDTNVPKECKQTDNSIFTAATQLPSLDNADTQLPIIVKQSMHPNVESRGQTLKTQGHFGGDRSDDQILFDEIDSQSFLEGFDSQPLLRQEDSPEDENVIIPLSQASQEDMDDVIQPNPIALKRANRIESDSTDCEDLEVFQAQKIPTRPIDDDLTDCEDDIDMEPNKLKVPESTNANFEDIATQCVVENVGHKNSIINYDEYLPTQVIGDYIEPNNDIKPKSVLTSETIAHENIELNFEYIATQVIGDDMDITNDNRQIIADKTSIEEKFEDMATQVLPENIDTKFEYVATQVLDEAPAEKLDCSNNANNQYSEEMIYSFKVPFSTPLKTKKKDTPKSNENKFMNPNIRSPKRPIKIVNLENDEQYYAATQELYEDLCSQRESSPEFVRPQTINMVNKSLLKEKQIEIINLDEEVVPRPVEGNKLANRFQHIENEISPKRKYIEADKSSENSDGDERINNYVYNLSTKMIREVIGVDKEVANVKRVPSDLSDVEVTPKKVRPFKFIETELPSSQEIKTSISMTSKTLQPESSSDSEPERNSTPIVFRKKKTVKQPKIDLMTKFEGPALPTRVITRVRKPTPKIQDSDEDIKKLSKSIRKLKSLPDFDDVNKEIISENVCQLKTKTEKKNNKEIATNLTKSAEVKKEGKARKNLASNKKTEDAQDIPEKTESEKLANRSKVKSKAVKNTDEEISKTINKENNESVNPTEEKSRSSRSIRAKKHMEKSESKESKSLPMEKYLIRKSRHKEPGKTEGNVLSTSNEKSEKTALLPETRSTRRKPKEDNISKNKDDSQKEREEQRAKELKKKRGRPRKPDNRDDEMETTTEKVDISKQTDIRRSKRQRPAKIIETKQNDRNSKSKPYKDQSTVYNISSESSVESPRPLKRSAGDNEAPIPKRTRSAISSHTSTVVSANTSSLVSSNRSLTGSTAARGVRTHYVLFTAFPYEEVKTKLEALGAVVVSDVMSCTLVLTLQIKRTFKLLCAVGLGKPIVGPNWVQACNNCNMIVDPWRYLIQDEASEKRFHYSLSRTLGSKRNFLKGYHVSSTPSVLPSSPEMKLIVECSGGTWQASGPKWICVSCTADRALWPQLSQNGATIVSSEFILSGVLKQAVNVEGNLLK